MADPTYTSFLKDPDQASRRAELVAFFGPNADKFLRGYDEQVVIANRAPHEKTKFSFNARAYVWPAFFIGPVWFFYRKMWAWGAGLTVLVLVLGLIPLRTNFGFPLGVALAFGGGSLYLSHAIKTIEQLRQQSPGGVLDPAQLAAVGGVSKTAGWVGGIIYVLLLLLSIAGLVLAAKSGARP